MEELPRNTNHSDKYPLTQYLVDKPDPELGLVLPFITHQNRMLRSLGFMDQRPIVLNLNRKG
jgi:hypothetical protein